MVKIAIITALCGNREQLHNPTVVHSNADYFAFVDDPKVGTIWNQLPTHSFSISEQYTQRRNAKIYKILPHLFVPGYDYYIWNDVSHDTVMNPQQIVEEYVNDADIGVFRHSQRNCLYDEANVLLSIGYDIPELLNTQIAKYRELEYPENNGLFELSTFIRANNHKINTAMLMWWEIICRYASRDQISLPFVLWKCGITPSILPGFSNGFNSRGQIGNNDLMPQTRQHSSSGG